MASDTPSQFHVISTVPASVFCVMYVSHGVTGSRGHVYFEVAFFSVKCENPNIFPVKCENLFHCDTGPPTPRHYSFQHTSVTNLFTVTATVAASTECFTQRKHDMTKRLTTQLLRTSDIYLVVHSGVGNTTEYEIQCGLLQHFQVSRKLS